LPGQHDAVWIALINAQAPIFLALAAFISALATLISVWKLHTKVDQNTIVTEKTAQQLDAVKTETETHRAVEIVQSEHIVDALKAIPQETGHVAAQAVIATQRQIPRRDDPPRG
jgi:hypothetical protein